MKCPNCHKNPATTHPRLGILPCTSCTQKIYKRPGRSVEITTESIKQQRSEFMDDIEQSHYKGALNKRWVQIYGEQAARDRGFTNEEIKNASYVYDGSGIRYYNDKT